MIQAYVTDGERLRRVEGPSEADLDRAVWIDMAAPSDAEEQTVEAALRIDVPTRAEMEEIESSSRLYTAEGGAFMTMTLPAGTDTDDPEMAPVTFVLAADRLITVRYHEPKAFQTFTARAARTDVGAADGTAVLIGLLETIVDRLADVLERAGREVEQLSRDVFQPAAPAGRPQPRDYRRVLAAIGRKGDLTSHIRESLVTLERLLGFFRQTAGRTPLSDARRERVKTLTRDTNSLADHAGYLSQKITFLLEATLGMISIEQNAIIKIFSVAAVIFLPPTLIASIYGMNFAHMPELSWPFGYPLALALMVIAAILPYLYFKRRGWL